MKVMLLNDTANIGHPGCRAVSNAHAKMLGRKGHQVTERFFLGELEQYKQNHPSSGVKAVLNNEIFRNKITSVDAVLVNGEGTIHHGAGSEYLNILGAALELGKPALLVNAVLESVDGFDDILSNLTDITVRDSCSQEYLQSKNIECRLVHDSFLEASFVNEKIVDLSGKVVVTDWHHQRDSDVGMKLLHYLSTIDSNDAWYYPILCNDIADAWKMMPSTFSTAIAVVTARHHAVYAAAIKGVPFVAFGGNTYKIEGFFKEFNDYKELKKCLNPDSINKAVTEAIANKHMFHEIRDKLISELPLDTFNALGGDFDPDGEERELEQLYLDWLSRVKSLPIDSQYRVVRRSYEMLMGLRVNQR